MDSGGYGFVFWIVLIAIPIGLILMNGWSRSRGQAQR